MFGSVSLPVWLLIVICVLAAWAALDRLLVPSVRWFIRRRVNRVLDTVGAPRHQDSGIHVDALKQVLIDRLVHDAPCKPPPPICRRTTCPARGHRTVCGRHARRVCHLNVIFYFRIGYWLARLASVLSRPHGASADDEGLRRIARPTRSSSSTTAAISTTCSSPSGDGAHGAFICVGEWARVRSAAIAHQLMGGFFVRRKIQNPLYRKVLERYVQMATEGGAASRVSEGGLSRDGRLRNQAGSARLHPARLRSAAGRRVVHSRRSITTAVEDRTLLHARCRGAQAQQTLRARHHDRAFPPAPDRPRNPRPLDQRLCLREFRFADLARIAKRGIDLSPFARGAIEQVKALAQDGSAP